MAGIERRGLTPMRAELLVWANGRTLELGAGTGHNLPHYGSTVSDLVLAEPDPHMARRLRQRIARSPPPVERVDVIDAAAEELPFDDGSFDTVVATLVLCTVDDLPRAAAEARRVLTEGGVLLFLEHVRSERPWMARFQDLIEGPWGFFAGGCHPNRATGAEIAGAGFWIEHLAKGAIPGAWPPTRPMIRGLARRPTRA